jgi:hypothetical protein
MKRTLILLIAIFASKLVVGQIKVYTKSNTANKRINLNNGLTPCRISKFEPPYLDTSIVYSKFLQFVSNNFEESMSQIVHQPEVDSIHYDVQKGYLTLYAKDERDMGASIFMWAKNGYLRWEFDIYHDLYKTFFSFKRVKSVSVFVNGKPMTAIPCVGDYDMIFAPNNILLKCWYVPCLDYGTKIDRDNPNNYSNFKTRIISKSVLTKVQ